MDKDFIMGIVVGLLGGALVASNSFKVRRAVKDGQEQVVSALNKMSDDNKSKNKKAFNNN